MDRDRNIAMGLGPNTYAAAATLTNHINSLFKHSFNTFNLTFNN